MSTALAKPPADFSQLPSTSMASNDHFNDLTRGGDFLGRVQLYTKGKAIDRALIPPGHYGVPEQDDEILDLGETIDVLPLSRRAKAVDFSDREAIITVYDPKSPEFQRIEAASAAKDSGCMHGIEFLVFERSTQRFLTMFFGTKSQRPEAKKLFPFFLDENGKRLPQPKPATLKARYVEAKSFSWHVPSIHKCSTPIECSVEKAYEEIVKFDNPTDGDVEKVEAPKNKRAR